MSETRSATRQRRGLDGDVRAAVEAHALVGVSPPDIYRALERSELRDRLPTLRTVQRVVAELTPRDTSGPWSIPDSGTGQQARSVLDALAAVIEQTEGRTAAFTRAEAEWIARLSQIAPELPPYEWWRVARLYLARQARGEQTDDLDDFLAFAPWTGAEGWSRYSRATTGGWIVHAPYFLIESIRDGAQPDIAPDDLSDADKQERRVRVNLQRRWKEGINISVEDAAGAESGEGDDDG